MIDFEPFEDLPANVNDPNILLGRPAWKCEQDPAKIAKLLCSFDLDEIAAKVCDELCKWPGMAKNADQLEEICEKCPVNEFMEVLKHEQ